LSSKHFVNPFAVSTLTLPKNIEKVSWFLFVALRLQIEKGGVLPIGL
jgi:hypothetical protein